MFTAITPILIAIIWGMCLFYNRRSAKTEEKMRAILAKNDQSIDNSLKEMQLEEEVSEYIFKESLKILEESVLLQREENEILNNILLELNKNKLLDK